MVMAKSHRGKLCQTNLVWQYNSPCLIFPFDHNHASLVDLLGQLPIIHLHNSLQQLAVVSILNAVKCNLMELTTKSACVPLEVSGVNTFAHVSEFHVLVDCSIA